MPGEETAKVVYRLVDAQQYAGCRMLVVGGGDSALEAAIAIAEQPQTTVTLSYRGKAFSRVKAKNRERIEAMSAAGRIEVLLESQVVAIEPHTVRLHHADEQRPLPNDAVIDCAGGELPMSLLRQAGIEFQAHFGAR